MADDPSGEQNNENEPGVGKAAPPAAVGWRDLHLWQIQPVRDVLLALAIVGLFMLGEATSIVTVPVLLAILLAYLFEPVIAWIEKRTNLARRIVVVVLIGTTVLLVVVPAILGITVGVTQFVGLLGSTGDRIGLVYESVKSPDNQELADRVVSEAGPAWGWIRDRLLESGTERDIGPILKSLTSQLQDSAGGVVGTTANFGLGAVRSVLGIVGGVFGVAFGIFLTGFFFFFASTGWVGVKDFARRFIPAKHDGRITDLAGKFDAVVSGFVRGRLTIAFVQSFVFSLGYFLIGVPAAFIVGPAVAILSIVPYLALVGIPVSIGLLWLEGYTGVRGAWWWVVGAPMVLYFFGQALDDYVLTPLIQGKSTNMDTPTILFATLAGGALFGVFGMLIAIPIAACVKILIAEIVWPAFQDWADGRREDPLPLERAK